MTPAELIAWFEFAPLIGLVLLALGVLVWVARKVAPVVRRTNHFLDDVLGEPARPGFDARPGLMQRVQVIEDRVGGIEHEVTYNHGSSMKDAVRRLETALHGHLAVSGPAPVVQVINKEEKR